MTKANNQTELLNTMNCQTKKFHQSKGYTILNNVMGNQNIFVEK